MSVSSLRLMSAFQFTPLREGRHVGIVHPPLGGNFNSRPSARGDLGIPTVPCIRLISIHAPPRGATCANREKEWREIFQFTPLREGRRAWRMLGLLESHFNSRPSARGDTSPLFAFISAPISIHAPPRGATRVAGTKREHEQFQFTPLREGRRGGANRGADVQGFQFTPLREGRLPRHAWRVHTRQFQFTPLREGRRQKICNFCKSFVQPLQISMA